jgi:hypothetical protein
MGSKKKAKKKSIVQTGKNLPKKPDPTFRPWSKEQQLGKKKK